ncbi:hypothetical protein TNIN_79961 [Trichonephila inaurata madagascariensis]|uniref:Uncharacterized protein n=1 Tax=Trichonephila inaurata madagascariensis TaxID=2747483 RepID=A0A8X7C5G2_9ARAC|nr:hypothetical protein TNIN_79961 [Trichonephila inaurata madagascariensis]
MSSTFPTFASVIGRARPSSSRYVLLADVHRWNVGHRILTVASTCTVAHRLPRGGYEFLFLILHVPIHGRIIALTSSALTANSSAHYTPLIYQGSNERLVSALRRHCNSAICLI